ncbi:MAG: DNA translocase FtsK 4TM domain-containing protein [Pseudomonadota bacterium]|nr:DNA translocase FtsK 4TM domain-containing protein [Pseudomonadota bacterium]MEE3101398.1 DNA translocase FtsK 4TM domain-containing protein [Pseudomonadota bacterium]
MALFSRSDLDDYEREPRDSFLPESWTEALRRRAAELAGLALAAIASAAALMLASYSPEDPSFFNMTGGAASNWLGMAGAYAADPLMRTLGLAAWMLPLLIGTWGWRLVTHEGEHRAWSRLLLSPLAVLAVAAALSSHIPPETWPHPYGLGGLIGDGAGRALAEQAPWPLALTMLVLSLGLAFCAAALSLLALGVDWEELGGLRRWMTGGLRWALGLVARLVVRLTSRRSKPAEPRSSRLGAPPPIGAAARREPAVEEDGDGYDDAALYDDDDYDDGADEPRLSARASVRGPAAEPGLRADARPEPRRPEAPRAEAPRSDAPRPEAPRAEPRGEPSVMDRIRNMARRIEPAPAAIHDDDPDIGDWDEDDDRVPAPRAEPTARVAAPAPVTSGPREPAMSSRALGDDYADAAPAPIPAPVPRAEVSAPARAPALSRRAAAEAQPMLDFDGQANGGWTQPPLSLLQNPARIERPHHSTEALEENARMLEAVLDDYGIRGEIVKVSPGPVVTMYELEPAPGLKASRVIGLADDIARSMSALAARVSTVPGRSIIGIELPNEIREKVLLRELFAARAFGDAKERLLIALGKDIAGAPIVANLARMPHLLIAGTTGSGKSVAINVMILSLLYRLSPKECRMIMIDPKMLELSVYDGIPHLLSPVVTDPKKAVVALKWTVAEMEDRYRKMSRMGVRNIEGYNQRVRDALAKGEAFTRTVQTGFDEDTGEPVFETQEFEPEELPFIVVVVDEMADLMMVAGKEIEACIQRLAQMARASGIHIIMATQRPSVDVITGTIKANFPTRISFQVTSKIDSRTILGEMGAEQLLGMGDMLYMAGGGRLTRVHGPFVSDEEVEEVVMHLKAQGEPDYVGGVTDGPDEEQASEIDAVLGLSGDETEGELYDRAVAIVARDRKCSTSYIQRKLAIGYQRAARLVEQMEEQGVVSPANKVGKREILVGEV